MSHALHVYQALWAMDQLSSPEASTAAKFDRVREAGFDGMAIDLGALTLAQAEATVPHFARTGLRGGLTAFPTSVEGLRPALALAHRIAAPCVVVIGQDMPVRVADMIPVIEGWLRVAEQEGMPVQFETHRNCITNDLFATVQLLDALPAMRLAADLSHYVVDREMPCPADAVSAGTHHAGAGTLGVVSRPGRRTRPDPARVGFPAERQMGRTLPRLVARRFCRLGCAACDRCCRPHVFVRAGTAGLCDHRCRRPRTLGPVDRGAHARALGAGDLGRPHPRRLTREGPPSIRAAACHSTPATHTPYGGSSTVPGPRVTGSESSVAASVRRVVPVIPRAPNR